MYQSKQGNLGLGKAIEYFVSKGYNISIPLNDTQKYDLVVDIEDKLYRVQVKTTRHKVCNCYAVELKNTGGSSGKYKVRYFDNTKSDYLFVYVADETMYLIPCSIIKSINQLSLNKNYEKYKVKINTMNESLNDMAV